MLFLGTSAPLPRRAHRSVGACRAAEIGCSHDVRTLDAIHLAADRLPRPYAFLTFDRRQAAAARQMDIDVIGEDPEEV